MRLNREEFLSKLESVSAGLAPAANELIEQSSSFVFREGLVMTYNDEIACWRKSGLPKGKVGVVRGGPLLKILRKMKVEEVEADFRDSVFVVTAKGEGFEVATEPDVRLPIDKVDRPGKHDWATIHEDFTEGISTVESCCGKDESAFVTTCIHVHPKWVEATDNAHAARYRVDTGVSESILLRRDAVKHLLSLDMTEFASTQNWTHFRNPTRMVFSVRKYVEPYPDLTKFFLAKGEKTIIPPGLAPAAEKAEVFSSENKDENLVTVHIKNGKMMVVGEGSEGKYWKRLRIRYSGPPLTFLVIPGLLQELTKRHSECIINQDKIVIDGGNWRYMAPLGAVEESKNGDGG